MVSTSDIEDLRNSFLKDVSAKGEDAVHPKDLERVKTDNHWLERFLKHQVNNKALALEMMWECMNWRKEFKTNEITEDNIKKDIIVQGGFFPYGKDIDGSILLVFKCIKHKKGEVNINDLKRCVVYWFERIERENKGEPVSLFFDMYGCGLSNMDMEFTKYLIGLFKSYYPYFLNYILIFEMPWVLSAAFKIIKSWLPEKAIEKIKFVSKKDIQTYVPLDIALECWGGTSTYQFSFIPEEKEKVPVTTNNNRKVHFVDGMSEISASSGDKENEGGDALKVQPSSIITFVKEGNEIVSNLALQNTDAAITLSYKLKTTSPEKFRVKPSTGILGPGAKTTVTVTVLPGYHIGGLSKDKFLIMSTIVDPNDAQDLTELWKNTGSRKLNQIRLKCIQNEELTRNGNAVALGSVAGEADQNSWNELTSKVSQLTSCQRELHEAVRQTQYYQIATVVLVVLLAVILGWVLKNDIKNISNTGHCNKPYTP